MAKSQKKISQPTPPQPVRQAEINPTSKAGASNSQHLIARIEGWIDARFWWISAAIFLISIGLRVAYFQEARPTPASTMHTWGSSDMEFYDATAKRIAGGDWLLDTAMQPYHSWHDEFAKITFEKYSDVAAPFYARFPKADGSGGADTLAARKAMISEVFGGKTFYQEPLYAYLVAATYRFFGSDPNWVYLWQMLLGALTNLLVFWVGRRLFGSLAGLLGALLVALSGPVLVYEMTLLRSTLTAFLTVLSVYFFQKTLGIPSPRNYSILGLIAGVSLLNQSYFLLFWLPALVWLGWKGRSDFRAAGLRLAVFFGGVLVAMSPLFYRNTQVGVPLMASAGAGGMVYTLYNSNPAQPLEPNFINIQSVVPLMHETGGSLLRAIPACWSSFKKTDELLKVYKQKLQGLFIWMEIPNNVSYYVFREFSPTLAALPAPYFWVAPLGVCGLIFGFWLLRGRFLPYFLMWLVSASPLFLSASLARYRVALVILTTLLAAFFIVSCFKFLLEKNWKTAVAGLAVVAVAFFFTSSIRERRFFTVYSNDIFPMYLQHYSQRLLAMEKAGENEAWVQLFGEFLGYLPQHFFELNVNSRVRYSNEASCCRDVARFCTMQATMLGRAGRADESKKFKERAEVLQKLADDFYKRIGG